MTIGWWSLFEYRDDPIEGGVDPSLNTLVDNIMYYNVKREYHINAIETKTQK